MNFGTIKDIFTEKLIESYSSESDKSINEGKVLYKKFLKTLKESETLKTAFIVFKNIENNTIKSEVSATEYLKESISLFENFKGKKSLNSEIGKLTSLLESNNIDYKGKEVKTIHKDLQNLITSKKNVHTLTKIQEAKENVVSWLISEKNENTDESSSEYVRENINVDKFLEIVTNKFNEKYKDSLNEEEKYILKVLRENDKDTIKDLVSSLVKETVILVNKHLSESGENIKIKEKLLDTKDVIYRMSEDNGDFNQNVLKLYELKKNLN